MCLKLCVFIHLQRLRLSLSLVAKTYNTSEISHGSYSLGRAIVAGLCGNMLRKQFLRLGRNACR